MKKKFRTQRSRKKKSQSYQLISKVQNPNFRIEFVGFEVMSKNTNVGVAQPATKVVFRAFIRPGTFAASGGLRSAKRCRKNLPKSAYTYINPRYDTSSPMWRPVAPRGRSVAMESSFACSASKLPPTVEAYHGRFDDLMVDIDDPCGSMMGKLGDLTELKAALQFPLTSSDSPSLQ